MSLDIIVKIQAPELVSAIMDLVTMFRGVELTVNEQPTGLLPSGPTAPAQPQAAYPQAAYPQTAPAVPVQQPVQPPAQAPVQQSAQPPAQATAPQQPQAVPTSAPTYTMEQLAVAATPLIDGGRRQELVNLLAAFGVRALTELPKERYGEFATALRQLGAKI